MDDLEDVQVFPLKGFCAGRVDALDFQEDLLAETLKRLGVQLSQNLPIRLFEFPHDCFPRRLASASGGTPLCDRSNSGETLVYNPPESFHCRGLAFKKVLEEPGTIERGRIGVSLTVVTELTDPIPRFARIDY